MISINKRIAEQDKKEEAARKKKEDAEEKWHESWPSALSAIKTMFPSVLEGKHEINTAAWEGVLFWVKGQSFSLIKEYYEYEGDVDYPGSRGYHLVLNRGWNMGQITTFTMADKYNEETEDDLAKAIRQDLNDRRY